MNLRVIKGGCMREVHLTDEEVRLAALIPRTGFRLSKVPVELRGAFWGLWDKGMIAVDYDIVALTRGGLERMTR